MPLRSDESRFTGICRYSPIPLRASKKQRYISKQKKSPRRSFWGNEAIKNVGFSRYRAWLSLIGGIKVSTTNWKSSSSDCAYPTTWYRRFDVPLGTTNQHYRLEKVPIPFPLSTTTNIHERHRYSKHKTYIHISNTIWWNSKQSSKQENAYRMRLTTRSNQAKNERYRRETRIRIWTKTISPRSSTRITWANRRNAHKRYDDTASKTRRTTQNTKRKTASRGRRTKRQAKAEKHYETNRTIVRASKQKRTRLTTRSTAKW